MRDCPQQLMLFTEASLAEVNPLAWQETKRERTIAVTFGLNFCGWSESLNRVGLLVKTYLASCISRRTQFVPTWSVKGTVSGYGIMKLLLLAHHTEGNECFLWRTPDAHCDRGFRKRETFEKRMERGMPLQLNDQVAHLWPTPTVYGNYNRKGVSATSGDGLTTAVKKQTPTEGGSLNPEWVEWLMGFPAGWTEVD